MSVLRLVSDHTIPPLRSLKSLSPDASERGILSVLRHLIRAAVQPSDAAQSAAFVIATERWGAECGTQIAQAAAELVQTLLALRSDPLVVHDPLDLEMRGLLTEDEEALFLLLRAMRQDMTPLARAALSRLTKGVMAPDLIRQALILSRILPQIRGVSVFHAQHSGLRVVQ